MHVKIQSLSADLFPLSGGVLPLHPPPLLADGDRMAKPALMPTSVAHGAGTDPSVPVVSFWGKSSAFYAGERRRQSSAPQPRAGQDPSSWAAPHPCPARGVPWDAATTPRVAVTPGAVLGWSPGAEGATCGSADGVAHETPLAKGEARVEPPFTVVKVEIKEKRVKGNPSPKVCCNTDESTMQRGGYGSPLRQDPPLMGKFL